MFDDAQSVLAAIPVDVLEVLDALERSGYPAYLVGGCVRDILLGGDVADWDIASAATPDDVADVFSGQRLLDTGSGFGTMTLLSQTQPQWTMEITTFRVDGVYSDGRRPDSIDFSTNIEDDLARRDFTINAMAYSPTRGLIDLFGGRLDLSSMVLRAVGDASSRLQEDALRIMRALRFAATLGLDIDKKLSEALHVNKGLLLNISAERIQAELMRLLVARGEWLLPVLLEYGDVLAVPIPEIADMIGFDQFSPWHSYDVWEHTVHALAASSPDDPIVRLALLLHDIGKPVTFKLDENGRGHFYAHAPEGGKMAKERLKALRFDNRTVDSTSELISAHFAPVTPETILKWLRRLGEVQLGRLFEVKRGDLLAHAEHAVQEGLPKLQACIEAMDKALADDACYSLAQMAVDGDDLKAIGIEPGRRTGETLEALLDAIVEEGLPNQRDILLSKASQLVGHIE